MTNSPIRLRLLALLLLLAGAAPAAFADEPSLALSAAVACLTLTPGASDVIEYPPELLLRKDGGTVPVEFTFSSPTEEPRVKVLNELAPGDLIDAVKAHVRRFRVPCMGAHDAPVTLRQDYVFDPDSHGKVMAPAAEDLANAERRKQLACLTHTEPGSAPVYPRDLQTQARAQGGRFLVQMRFFAPDKAPEIQWLAAAGDTSFKRSIQWYIEGLRLPCLQGGPIYAQQSYTFKMEGDDERTLINDMTLRTLVSVSRSIPRPVFFNFNNMACPFQLRMKYYQPFAANLVGELETTNLARRPFMNWLTQVQLNLSKEDSLGVMGESFVLSVPCGKLDLSLKAP